MGVFNIFERKGAALAKSFANLHFGSMGIKGLMPFISDHAPLAIKETEMKSLTGRTIAIDACAPHLLAP